MLQMPWQGFYCSDSSVIKKTKGVERLFVLRYFYMANEKGETLVAATLAWLLIDIEKERPHRYVKWITDCFSQDQFSNRRIASVQINYLKETLLGNAITLFKTPEDILANEYFIEGVSSVKG